MKIWDFLTYCWSRGLSREQLIREACEMGFNVTPRMIDAVAEAWDGSVEADFLFSKALEADEEFDPDA
jgi:hypothetical protein